MSEEPKKAERAPTQMRRTDIPADTILIGKKPIMAYATAVMMHYNTGAKKLTLKARGRAISTAVDVAEVVNNRFFQGGLSNDSSRFRFESISKTLGLFGGEVSAIQAIAFRVFSQISMIIALVSNTLSERIHFMPTPLTAFRIAE